MGTESGTTQIVMTSHTIADASGSLNFDKLASVFRINKNEANILMGYSLPEIQYLGAPSRHSPCTDKTNVFTKH
jgi:hypothetical protein